MQLLLGLAHCCSIRTTWLHTLLPILCNRVKHLYVSAVEEYLQLLCVQLITHLLYLNTFLLCRVLLILSELGRQLLNDSLLDVLAS